MKRKPYFKRPRVPGQRWAKAANVGEQTVRDAEKGISKDLGWTTAMRLCRALKRELPALECWRTGSSVAITTGRGRRTAGRFTGR